MAKFRSLEEGGGSQPVFYSTESDPIGEFPSQTGLIVGSGGLQLSHKRDVEGRARQFS
jgi:hypothetical protein